MNPDRIVGEQVRRVRLQVEDLHRRARLEGATLPALVEEALEALYTSLEELQVSEEELRLQNEELVSSRARLDEERLRYLELFQHAPDAYLVTGTGAAIREANHAASALLNVSLARLRGKPLAVFVPPERRREFRQRLAQVLELGRLDGWETVLAPRGAAPVAVSCTVTAVRDEGGRAVGLRWLVRDRTPYVEAEVARRAVAARDEMVAVLSHDLRNPLNSVTLAAAVLAEYGDPGRLSERDRKQVEIIRRAAGQMTALVQDLLDASALETGAARVEPAPCEARALLDAALDAFCGTAEAAGIELVRAEPGAPLPAVRADRERILQVLSNVIGNALKFTPAGGTVRLEASPQAAHVRFTVRDSGPGIDPAHLPRLFDRFWQARRGAHGGSGLGLAIARAVVEAHGGRIWAESAPGEGAAFHFTLPADG